MAIHSRADRVVSLCTVVGYSIEDDTIAVELTRVVSRKAQVVRLHQPKMEIAVG